MDQEVDVKQHQQQSHQQRNAAHNSQSDPEPYHRCSPLRVANDISVVELTDDQRDILSPKTEAVAEHVPHPFLSGGVRDIVEVAFRVGHFVIDRGRQDPVANGHDAGDQLDGSGCRDEVPQHAFAAADRYFVRLIAEYFLDGERLDTVVDLGAGTVCVDVA